MKFGTRANEDEQLIPTRSLGVRVPHPWEDANLASLYDAFPFLDDLPLYLELAEAKGGNVLELACGTGRVLVPLATAGYYVVGVDASEPMLTRARAKLEEAGPVAASRAEVVIGDMRTLDLGRTFDLAIIAVKSFAYLPTRKDQERALSTVAAHLRPGGLLALDLLNPQPTWLSESPGSLRQDLVERRDVDGCTVARTEAVVETDLAEQVRVIRSAYEVVSPNGTVRKHFVEWAYRYVFRFEAEHLLERAGFEIEALYGGYQKEPFQSDSRNMIFIARQP